MLKNMVRNINRLVYTFIIFVPLGIWKFVEVMIAVFSAF